MFDEEVEEEQQEEDEALKLIFTYHYLEAGGSRGAYDAAAIENLGSQCCTPTSCP
jgi:hypothetical protein